MSEERLQILEARVSKMENTVIGMDGKLDQALSGINSLTALNNNISTVSGAVKKYGPKALHFGAGLMTAAGIGNPAIWKFISHFRF